MKSRILAFFLILLTSSLYLSSCKKINEATELGEDLIPAIDNVTTFEKFLATTTENKRFTDSTQLLFSDNVAIGHITNDQDFGSTHADAYFNVSHNSPGVYPFVNKDSVSIDSVILSLTYAGVYGDTTLPLTVRVFEIAQNAGFDDTTLYKFSHPDFLLAPGQLGSKTFVPVTLKDTITHIRAGDTTKLVNVLRIPLDTIFGRRFVNYDTTNSTNGAFRNDSIFKSAFRGFAIKADNIGNTLAYFTPANSTGTKLTIYFRYRLNGANDTSSVDFTHRTNGQADVITRTEAGGWASSLGSGVDDKVYIQSTPNAGSYAAIKIPGLDTFQNAVIHRAELILTHIPSANVAQDQVFTPPPFLFLDHVNNAGDTAFAFEKDMGLTTTSSSVTYSASLWGGILKGDNTYRFNITRYVQGIITRHERNDTLRLYAPLRTTVYAANFLARVPIPVNPLPADGRIVLAGGTYATDPSIRVRLRIVYSKL